MTESWKEIAPAVFLSPLFSKNQCDKLLQAVRSQPNREGDSAGRPNSMQDYGVVVHDPALSAKIDRLANQQLRQSIKALFPNLPHYAFADHHAFLTSYGNEANNDLSLHVDASHITLNICLDSNVQGTELVFSGTRCSRHLDAAPDKEPAFHAFRQGQALLHAGNQRHMVTPLKSGTRHNLVIWYRLQGENCDHDSSWVRQGCPVCSQ